MELDSQLFSPLIFFFFFWEPNFGFLCARALTLDLHRSEMGLGLGGLFIRKLNHHVPLLIFCSLKTFLSEGSNFLSIFIMNEKSSPLIRRLCQER